MNKTLKYYLIGVGITAAALIALSLIRRRRAITMVNKIASDDSSTTSAPTPSATSDAFPLKRGLKGDRVKALQAYLNNYSSAGLVVDGIFGSKTEAAVTSEQTPFSSFKLMFPDAVEGQVTEDYFNKFVKPVQT